MSSTGLRDNFFNYVDSDIINVNQNLIVNDIDIIETINDISNNIIDISNNIIDISNNVIELWDKVIDLSNNVTEIKISNDLQGSAITELQTLTGSHTAQIELNTAAIVELTTQTDANTAAIAATITATAVDDIVTGLVSTIDSKVPSSYFGSGNVGIYGLFDAKYISVVFNIDHFEDLNFPLVNNKVFSLKEPYKSLPTSKNNYFTCESPLIKNDGTNKISIDLSSYLLKSTFDSSYNNIINTKQNNLFFNSPLLKDISNNVTIDLSSYLLKSAFDLSYNNLNTTKQNVFTCISPLIKNDISNNIRIDLSGYLLKSAFDLSYNNLNTTKQNVFTCISPLIKNDISNNIRIDLSGYVLKTTFDSSYNTIITSLSNKQDNLTFNSPLVESNNNVTIDLSGYLLKSGGTITNDLNINNGYISVEQQYPPKLYNAVTTQTTTTLLSKTVFTETFTLYSGIPYGSGDYIIYSSSSYNSTFTKKLLFNYNYTSSETGGHWAYQYNSATGIYDISNNNFIKSDYLGDWLIIKLPKPIILSKYRFYNRSLYLTRAPGEWKFYGSNDGINFNEITEAHNLTRLTTDNYLSGYYEKILASTFTTPYQYIGFTVNKLSGNDIALNFAEFQIFGEEVDYNTAFLGIGKTNPSVELDVSGNITSLGRIKANNLVINEGNIDTTGRNLICYCNNPGVYFTDNSFNSFFTFSSAINTNSGLQINPFITVYNRMFKNGANTALKIQTYGGANAGVNSSTNILLDSGSDPTPGANVGSIKFNVATNSGAVDRLIINPSTSIFYNNVGIGKTPTTNLDVSGNTTISGTLTVSNNVVVSSSGNIYTKAILSSFAGIAGDVNVLARTTGTINIISEQGNINFNTNSVNRMKIDPSGFIFAYNNFDVSGNIIADNFIGPGTQLSALNASNISSGTLSVSRGGTGTSNFTNNQILIGNGTSALKTTANLIFDTSANGLGIGVTQLSSQTTSLQVKDRRLWIDSVPNSSISVISTEKYGTGTTESYIRLLEDNGTDYYVKDDGTHTFRCSTNIPLSINKYGVSTNLLSSDDVATISLSSTDISATNITVGNINVVYDIITTKIFGSNTTSKNLIKFTTKPYNGLYYYNLDIAKYYQTGQNINGNDYKIFNLTSWAEDGFSIINKCTVYISSQGGGIKYIMFYDNWGAYLPNGNQSGWQRDTNTLYMSFVSNTQKNIITILENLL